MIILRNKYFFNSKEDNVATGVGAGILTTAGIGGGTYLAADDANKRIRFRRDLDLGEEKDRFAGSKRRVEGYKNESLSRAKQKYKLRMNEFERDLQESLKKGDKAGSRLIEECRSKSTEMHKKRVKEIEKEAAEDLSKYKSQLKEATRDINSSAANAIKRNKKLAVAGYIAAPIVGLGAGYGAYKIAKSSNKSKKKK